MGDPGLGQEWKKEIPVGVKPENILGIRVCPGVRKEAKESIKGYKTIV